MTTTTDPIEAVAKLAPPPDAPPGVTRRERAVLVDHIARSASAGAPAAARPTRPTRSVRPFHLGRGRRPAALVAVAAAVVLVLLGASLLSHRGTELGPERVTASPAAATARRVVAQPAPMGDATVLLRTMAAGTPDAFTSADLYTDDGRYANGPDVAFLREQAAGILAGSTDEENDRETPYLNVFRTLSETPPQQAYDHFVGFLKERDRTQDGPGGERSAGQYANLVWVMATDGFAAAAADPAMRAGILNVLAANPDVTSKEVTEAGRKQVALTYRPGGVLGTDVVEIDAATGLPIRVTSTFPEQPGVPGEVLVTTYDVQRVTLANWLP